VWESYNLTKGITHNFLILVIADISGFEKIHKGFDYYIGNDPKVFRSPMTNFCQKEAFILILNSGLSNLLRKVSAPRRLLRSYSGVL
jgi:hypothetical protein